MNVNCYFCGRYDNCWSTSEAHWTCGTCAAYMGYVTHELRDLGTCDAS